MDPPVSVSASSEKTLDSDIKQGTTTQPTGDQTEIGKEGKSNQAATWPALDQEHPLTKFSAKLESLLQEADYNEVYGLQLVDPPDFHTYLILQKFLRANANDFNKAHSQLSDTLKWRKEFRPLQTFEESYSRERFGGLGYVTTLEQVPDSTNSNDTATFNLYGAVKDPKLTFEDIDGFLRWRVNLMELSIRNLDLSNATEPIPDYGKGSDPYQSIQVHDYMQVSFIRQNPFTKAASSKAIEIFKNYYPETLSRKFFINVPVLMGWMFTAVSMVLSKETVKKFNVLSYGNTLNTVLGDDVPVVYGGKGQTLEERGTTPKLEG